MRMALFVLLLELYSGMHRWHHGQYWVCVHLRVLWCSGRHRLRAYIRTNQSSHSVDVYHCFSLCLEIISSPELYHFLFQSVLQSVFKLFKITLSCLGVHAHDLQRICMLYFILCVYDIVSLSAHTYICWYSCKQLQAGTYTQTHTDTHRHTQT